MTKENFRVVYANVYSPSVEIDVEFYAFDNVLYAAHATHYDTCGIVDEEIQVYQVKNNLDAPDDVVEIGKNLIYEQSKKSNLI